ncbi:hypothetical protein N8772_01715 [Rickettsiales bacterium]|nr:hypothetical protein [Rickettsiales bacterium]MDB2550245.1 hypothetical protein [Rickettsiales bacterium]
MKKIKKFFRKKRCTVTIGFGGALFTFHRGKEIEKTVLFSNIEEAKKSFKSIFKNREKYPIYILLDDNDQIYKQKTYPAIRSIDLAKLIKKDLVREGPKTKNETIQNSIKHGRRKDKKWDMLLFWIELKKEIVEWIDFLILRPKNRLVGIYLLPIESRSFLENVNKIIEQDFSNKKQSHITIVTLNTKVSGLRQFIFYKKSLILNREPDHNLEDPDFVTYFEQDMLRIIQYLKRSFPEVKVSNINFINILPKQFITKVDKLRTKSLKVINYESGVISKKVGIVSNKKGDIEILSDEILSNNFVNSKRKLFRFSTNRIKKINILYIFTYLLFLVNISVIIFLGFVMAKIFAVELERDEEIISLELKESNLEIKLNEIRKKSLGAKDSQDKFYEIVDFGEIDNFFNNKEDLYLSGLQKASIVPKDNNIVKDISYSLKNFTPNKINSEYMVNIKGLVINKKGDIDKLFTNFDSLILSLKTSLSQDKLKYTDIPNNINFNRKFYKYPFDITIESQQ